jgi:hypothetical protein
MSHRHKRSDLTRNFKEFRVVIRRPGQRDQYVTAATKKVLRKVRDEHLASGATVEEQKHTGWGVYRTTRVHPAGPGGTTGEQR